MVYKFIAAGLEELEMQFGDLFHLPPKFESEVVIEKLISTLKPHINATDNELVIGPNFLLYVIKQFDTFFGAICRRICNSNFTKRIDKQMHEALKDKLFELSASKVNLDRYYGIIEVIRSSDSYHVSSDEFFREIDLPCHLISFRIDKPGWTHYIDIEGVVRNQNVVIVGCQKGVIGCYQDISCDVRGIIEVFKNRSV